MLNVLVAGGKEGGLAVRRQPNQDSKLGFFSHFGTRLIGPGLAPQNPENTSPKPSPRLRVVFSV